MSDDIRPGDVVVCVDASQRALWARSHTRLRVGRMHRVSSIGRMGLIPAVWLSDIKSADPSGGFFADRFRKIDAADDEFIAQVRACRPIKIGEPA